MNLSLMKLVLILLTSLLSSKPMASQDKSKNNSSINPLSVKAPAIGAAYGGGRVGCTTLSDGIKNLIVSSKDEAGGVAWSNIKTKAVGTRAQSPVDGFNNSRAIIHQKGHKKSAAKICRDLRAGGFNDWYLPAKKELDCLYNNRPLLGEYTFEFDGYWSSTEAKKGSSRHVWYQHFANGYQGVLAKPGEGGQIVRCVREFKP